MFEFSQFNITSEQAALIGQKININQVINMKIEVENYKIKPSNFAGKSDCLYLQFKFNNESRIIFISSRTLVEMIEKVPKSSFPFQTTIKYKNNRMEFT